MKSRVQWMVMVLLLALTVTVSLAQRRGFGRQEAFRPELSLNLELAPGFEKDVFTFVRIRYTSHGEFGYGRRGQWSTDWPDAEYNFTERLQQVTSLKVGEPKVLELTDPDLFNYPFIYIVEPGDLFFGAEEVTTLRKYLLNGGFLMVDDFWGPREYDNFYQQIKRVFPEREPAVLDLDHPVFRSVFPLKEKPQLPSINQVRNNFGTPEESYERGAKGANYLGIYDDKGRMMVIICHNTDLGDGWEREGEEFLPRGYADPDYYFREYSEKKAYPMGINIIFYAMTH